MPWRLNPNIVWSDKGSRPRSKHLENKEKISKTRGRRREEQRKQKSARPEPRKHKSEKQTSPSHELRRRRRRRRRSSIVHQYSHHLSLSLISPAFSSTLFFRAESALENWKMEFKGGELWIVECNLGRPCMPHPRGGRGDEMFVDEESYVHDGGR